MSASLVGSEMCIRDREEQRAAGKARGERRRSSEWRGRGRIAQEEQQRRGTVSYTHLTLPTICSV
eukprot:9757443-Alexandrium_andersonii.AAC.1